jgi:hypothetical protein
MAVAENWSVMDRAAMLAQIKAELEILPNDFCTKIGHLLSRVQKDPDLVTVFGIRRIEGTPLRLLVRPIVLSIILGMSKCGLNRNFDENGLVVIRGARIVPELLFGHSDRRTWVVREDQRVFPSLEFEDFCILSRSPEEEFAMKQSREQVVG